MHHGIINLPALFILLLLSLLLIKGTQESATVNGIIVFIKVSIVLIFIAVGWQFINPGKTSRLVNELKTVGCPGSPKTDFSEGARLRLLLKQSKRVKHRRSL